MNNIQWIRLKRELTHNAVQKGTGIHQEIVAQYEGGHRIPTTEDLIRLARFYDTSMDYLMGLTDQEKPYPRKR